MSAVADDRVAGAGAGLALAVTSAASFGLSGALASGLLSEGWSPGAVVLARIGIAALVVLPVTLVALRGHWAQLRRAWRFLLLYGAAPIALAQFAYFSAVRQMDVGPAILIEYTAPAAVVVFLWIRRGERPSRLTLAGAGIAALGLVLVLDLLSGADLAPGGVLWALLAMVGAASYFLLSANDDVDLPPLALAGGGLVVATIGLALLGLVGLMPLEATTADAVYAGTAVPWWLPLVGLGVVTAGLAYCVGVAAVRLLGSRVASFVGLLEVLFGVLFAWLLLDQLPGPLQLVGGGLVLAGVVVVKLGEREVVAEPVAEGAPAPEPEPELAVA